METLEETARVITSKPAQRAAVNVALLVSSAVTLFGLASLATALFFQNFVPDQFITTPLYLQYQSGTNPYGVAPLIYPSPKLQQDYDISLSLSMPRSPPNTERGNFMVSLYLVKDSVNDYKSDSNGRKALDDRHYLEAKKVLFKARRSALMPYEDPILSVAKRVLFMGYYLLLPRSQARSLTVELAERVSFDKSALQPTAAFIEIEAGQDIQIYSASLTLTAQLRGLRWLMFHYRLITYMTFTFLFWVCEVLFMCLAWAIWSATTTPQDGRNKGITFRDGEGDDIDDEHDDHPDRTAGPVAHARYARIKREPEIKKEEEDEEPQRLIYNIPMGEAEADDEDGFDDGNIVDGSGNRSDSGIGTSYKEEGSESLRRRASRDMLE
ncbi:adipose-regulatory protein [Metarhizium robertsii]|uniref:SH3 domain protein n=2 Tax=Metarhizium robertsii TaxID=568076 RepID=E9EP52_METRA|nr:SH3 domain protein [Metarhizium robertsii ARSEF 23]EFZ02690.2 SH3 domain protein [Metarhizium robertsii ARSEF 23]EXV05909.1 adipose-regulatory protein [Metarhizium robertsii]